MYLKSLPFLGYILIFVAFIGTLFFRHYKGSLIKYPALWYLAFISIGIIGIWLIYINIRNKALKEIKSFTLETASFKSTSIRISIDFDKCEFKNGSYSREVENKNEGLVDIITSSSGSLPVDKITTENVVQSYIVYTDDIDGTKSRFISQAFPLEMTNLKFHTLNNKVTLWVDKVDPKKYIFEIAS